MRDAVLDVETAVGTARVHMEVPASASALLVLGHGAGGGVEAPDLLAARDAARQLGMAVGRVEQPYRVAGRRVAERAERLDVAWLDVCAALLRRWEVPLVVGGRSSGARVACRTADRLAARGVLALAFPLVPPGRPHVTRSDELTGARVPRLVVQGSRDAFGVPPAGPGVQVHVVAGADHGFRVRRADGRTAAEVRAEVGTAVGRWLQTVT